MVLAAIVACYFIFDKYLNLEYLQTQKDQIATAYQQNKYFWWVLSNFCRRIHPRCYFLTLTAGFLFGSKFKKKIKN